MPAPSAFAALLALASAVVPGVHAAEPAAPPPPFTRAEVERFVDGAAGRALGRGVPGAVVVVVKDGAVLLAKAYGLADITTKRPVSAETTRFRVGSVSKVVTATTVMQLVERGRLKLDADVAGVVPDVPIPRTFPEPITLAHLLTHTAGFEERLAGTAARSEAEVLPLGAFLARDLPARVFAPGELIAYSNHGYCLLGHAIETASGAPFARHVKENVLAPLGMARSDFTTPRADDPDLATGYEVVKGVPRAVPLAHLQIAPAAGLTTTGADMARFLLAHLAEGRDGGPMLRPETARLMHARHASMHPRLPGMAYGFFESLWFSRRGLYHPGGIRGTMSLLSLAPELGLGIFVSNNGYDENLGWQIVDGLTERFFPGPLPKEPAIPLADAEAAGYAGIYRHVKHAETTWERVALLRGRELSVAGLANGALAIGRIRHDRIAPLAFREPGRFELVAFGPVRRDGRRWLAVDQEVFVRVPWWQGAAASQILLVTLVCVFVAGAFGGRGTALTLADRDPPPPTVLLAGRLVRLTAGVDLALLVALAVLFARTKPGDIWLGVPPSLAVWRVAAWASVPAALAASAALARAWSDAGRSDLARARAATVCAGGLALVPFLAWWRLLAGI